MDDYKTLEELNKKLTEALNKIKKTSADYANAYRAYRVALRKEHLRLRSNGIPVTIADDLARGEETVAALKEQEIITEALYRSNIEAINVYKLQIKIINEQIRTEYNNGQ